MYSLNPDGEADDYEKQEEKEDSQEQETLSWKSDSDSEQRANQDTVFEPLLELFNFPHSESFLIDSQGGLSDTSVLAQFPCLAAHTKFYVWLGHTGVDLFGKSTLMNLCNLAESSGCSELFILVDKFNPDLKAFARLFKVIDAEKMHSTEVSPMLKEGVDAKKIDTVLYKIDL